MKDGFTAVDAFEIIGSAFRVFVHAALVGGGAVVASRRFFRTDHTAVLIWIAYPLAVLGAFQLLMLAQEAFIAHYGANKYEVDAFHLRILSGHYRVFYWINVVGVIATQALWFRCVWHSGWFLFLLGGILSFV